MNDFTLESTLERMPDIWTSAGLDWRIELLRRCGMAEHAAGMALTKWERIPQGAQELLAERHFDIMCERLLKDVMAATVDTHANDASLCGYDYHNQAWVEDGKYVACGHGTPCDCFGTRHAGEPIKANADIH
jgi:hypothetical protein